MRLAAAPAWLRREGYGLVALTLLGVVLLSVLPVARLALTALGDGGLATGVARFLTVATGNATLSALWTTLTVSLLSGIAALVIGALVALVLATSDVPAKRLIAFLFVMSLMVAPQVAALAFKAMAGPGSPLLNTIGLAPPPGTANPMLSLGGIVVVMALHHAPLAAIAIAAGLASIPRSAIEAALIDGAPSSTIVYSVVLPLIAPHVIGAGLLVIVASFGNFGIPALLGLPVNITTLPTLIYQSLSSFGPSVIHDAARISIVMAFVALAGVALTGLVLRHAPEPLEADHAMVPFWRLGRARLPVAGLLWLLIAISALLPGAALLASALVPAYGMTLSLDTITFDRFAEVLFRQAVTARAFTNSLLFAGSAALVLSGLSIMLAYTLVRLTPRLRTSALALVELCYALPGVVVAIACILLFLKPLPLIGVSLYATPLIILVAYLMRFLALALKPPLAAMILLGRDQEEAAAVFGATLFQRLWYVVLPALAPAAAAGGLMAFLLAFNELTVSALLYSAGTETLGVALLSLDDAGLGAEAAAVGVIATVIVAAIMIALDRMAPRLPAGVLPWITLAGTSRAAHSLEGFNHRRRATRRR